MKSKLKEHCSLTLSSLYWRAEFLAAEFDFVAAVAGCNFHPRSRGWLVQWPLSDRTCLVSARQQEYCSKLPSSTAQLCQRLRCSVVNKPSVYWTKPDHPFRWNILFSLRTLCWDGKITHNLSHLELSARLVCVSVCSYLHNRLHWQPAINSINSMKSRAPRCFSVIWWCLEGLLTVSAATSLRTVWLQPFTHFHYQQNNTKT